MNEQTQKKTKIFWTVAIAAGLVAAMVGGLAVGYLIRGASAPAGRAVSADQGGKKAATLWTCSMHPQIKLPKPGLCPLCRMDLIPLETGEATGSLRELTLGEHARKLMDIQTAAVERKFVEAEVRMVGKIDYDETRVKYITSWVAGRLDRLYVDYTGVPVKKGDHMVSLYSPELLSAQEELLQALDAVKNLKNSDIGIVRETTEATVTAAREKLRLWGLRPDQIAQIEKRGKTIDHMTIHAPIGGIVIHKNAQEGMYVKTGMRIYTIADFSQVWVRLDAYEADLSWLRYGQKVEFTTEAYPGEVFTGTIAFIDPILTQTTRTVKVRLNAANPAMRLKPGMFVRAVAKTRFDASGKVMDPSLAGKWMCPMHPDIVKKTADKCDICEMPLVRTESLGYVGIDPDKAEKPLVIPASAALITGGRRAGSRAVVYLDVDPSLLRPEAVRNWQRLLATIRQRLKPPKNKGKFVNLRCPIMGRDIDPKSVTPDLIAEFRGGKVAFCCAACPPIWNKLTDAEKQAKLAAASSDKTPFKHFWGLLGAEFRQKLLAVEPDEFPPLELQHAFVREVNRILDAGLLERGLDALPPRERTRHSRLVLEKIFPEDIAKGKSGPTFEGREIVLGPRAGNYYLVRHGLREGQRVVTNGNFKLDAELQIRAQPSMMTPEVGGTDTAAALPAVVRDQLRGVTAAARKVDEAIAAGELAAIRLAFATLEREVDAVRPERLTGRTRLLWDEYAMLLKNDGVEGRLVKDLAEGKRVAKLMDDHVSSLSSKFDLSHKHPPAVSPEFRKQLSGVVKGYLDMQAALASDKLPAAVSAAKGAEKALTGVDMKLLAGDTHMAWMKHSAELAKILAAAAGAKGIQAMREAFALLSEEMMAVVKRFGPAGHDVLYQLKCPMAFENRGATWLQTDERTRNPYFGSAAAMFRCGSVIEVVRGAGGRHE